MGVGIGVGVGVGVDVGIGVGVCIGVGSEVGILVGVTISVGATYSSSSPPQAVSIGTIKTKVRTKTISLYHRFLCCRIPYPLATVPDNMPIASGCQEQMSAW